jgi:hypothetical protein
MYQDVSNFYVTLKLAQDNDMRCEKKALPLHYPDTIIPDGF